MKRHYIRVHSVGRGKGSLLNLPKPNKNTRPLIERAAAIVDEYAAQGLRVTIRQLYYQHVARGLLPPGEASYDAVAEWMKVGRVYGIADWNGIEDRGRELHRLSTWDTPSSIIQSAAASYRLDPWEDQPRYVEVWCEKDAMAGILQPVCDSLRVAFHATRGFDSVSELHDAAERLRAVEADGRRARIFYLGDHDPAGMLIPKKVRSYLYMFMESDDWPDVQRLALTREQIERYNPVPFQANPKDNNAPGYIEAHGRDCWELDALEPGIVETMVREAVNRLVDRDAWDATMEREADDRAWLSALAEKESLG